MIGSGRILITILALLFAAFEGEAACMRGRLKSPINSDGYDSSSVEGYCEYRNGRYWLKSRWELDFPDCLKCSCTESGLTCCGYGIKAGPIAIPDGYKLAPDTCKVEFIET